ncbi:MAG: MFS transporter [Legionella sp.]|nr:MFS transporter [Legionella sp.]
MLQTKQVNFQSPYLIWFLGAFFFFIDYIIRVSPSILTPTLMHYFHVNAFTVGGFSAFFYYTYIAMQIPVGVLVDRYGPKWLLILSALICGASTFIFANMSTINIGFLSRILMGFGASFAFVGTLKLISLWFAPRQFAFLAGLTQAFGMLGAMVGQGPMAVINQMIGWRTAMNYFGYVFLILSALMLVFIENKSTPLETDQDLQPKIQILESFRLIFRNSQNWLNCIFIGLLYAPSACFGEQWGVSFLSLNQGISIEAAGHEIGMMFIGLALGCPILGWVSDKIQRRVLVMRISVIICLILLSIIIYGKLFPNLFDLHPFDYTLMLFIYGFFNSGIVCSYALASEINPAQLTGIALGITNMASVLIGAMMIPVVGFVLDHFSGGMIQGQLVFHIKSYQIAFIALPIGFIVAFIISFFQKETYCQRPASP